MKLTRIFAAAAAGVMLFTVSVSAEVNNSEREDIISEINVMNSDCNIASSVSNVMSAAGADPTPRLLVRGDTDASGSRRLVVTPYNCANGVIIAAAYSGGCLKASSAVQYTGNSIEITLNNSADADTVKVMLWDSINGMTPICGSKLFVKDGNVVSAAQMIKEEYSAYAQALLEGEWNTDSVSAAQMLENEYFTKAALQFSVSWEN